MEKKMLNRKLFLLISFTLLALATAFAQEEDSTTSKWDGCYNHKFNFNFFHHEFKGKPSASLFYGFSQTGLNNFTGSFSKPNLIELKLGYTDIKSMWKDFGVVKYTDEFFHISNFSTDLSGDNYVSKLSTDMWRFGLEWASGYGYELNNSAIIPYSSFSIDWSRLRIKNMPLNPTDQILLVPFNKTFRFGTSVEGGIKYEVVPHFFIDAGYQRSIIFPHHLFWKWAGSSIVEMAGQGAIDTFIKKIIKSSPSAGPIMSFILKNSLSYGIYELRREKMNWPFESTSPLTYDQLKIGFSFVF
jgi:hypothetical protein